MAFISTTTSASFGGVVCLKDVNPNSIVYDVVDENSLTVEYYGSLKENNSQEFINYMLNGAKPNIIINAFFWYSGGYSAHYDSFASKLELEFDNSLSRTTMSELKTISFVANI